MGAAQDALVPDPAGEPVGVEAFEEELGRASRAPEQVAEARQGDLPGSLALLDERGACALERIRRDGKAVSDANEPAVLLEVASKRRIGDPDRVIARLGQLGLERLSRPRLLPERRARSGEVRLRPSTLDLEQRRNRRG